MKRANNLMPQITELANLQLAFWKAQKGKSKSQAVYTYRTDLHKNLLRLQTQIIENKLDIGHYTYFKIYDPKERQICASPFREQVLQHALMNICHPYFERVHIFDSYASRRGKGTYAAVERAKRFTKQYPFFLKLDVRKFFDSIHHPTLKSQLLRLFKETSLLQIFHQIIDTYSTVDKKEEGRGVPIGNLSSQYFANHYLTGLDHFIKEDLQAKAYVRYMDDLVIWHHDKHWLKEVRNGIKGFVEDSLKMTLKPALLNYSIYGLPFLGYQIFPDLVRLTRRSKIRYIRKMGKVDEMYHSGIWDERTCQRHLLPLIAFTLHAQTAGLRQMVNAQ